MHKFHMACRTGLDTFQAQSGDLRAILDLLYQFQQSIQATTRNGVAVFIDEGVYVGPNSKAVVVVNPQVPVGRQILFAFKTALTGFPVEIFWPSDAFSAKPYVPLNPPSDFPSPDVVDSLEALEERLVHYLEKPETGAILTKLMEQRHVIPGKPSPWGFPQPTEGYPSPRPFTFSRDLFPPQHKGTYYTTKFPPQDRATPEGWRSFWVGSSNDGYCVTSEADWQNVKSIWENDHPEVDIYDLRFTGFRTLNDQAFPVFNISPNQNDRTLRHFFEEHNMPTG
jgi:hypothetical protein